MNSLNEKSLRGGPLYLFLLLSVTSITPLLQAGIKDNLIDGCKYVSGKAGSLWSGTVNYVKNDIPSEWNKGKTGKAKILGIGAAGAVVTAAVLYYVMKNRGLAKQNVK